MSFRACPNREDPFERVVRETYGANVIEAPRAGIVPLTTVARQDDRVEPRGHLRHLFEGGAPDLPKVTSRPAAAIAGIRSSELKASLGFDLSSKFLSALGLPVPSAAVTATIWNGAEKFAFEVRDVVENQVDIGELGKAVAGRRVANNAATTIFLEDESQQLLLVTRTLSAPAFAVRAISASGQAVNADVDGVADLIGAAQMELSWKREKDDWVTFRGAIPVVFAFSVVPCTIDAGRWLRFGLTRRGLSWGVSPGGQMPIASRPPIGDGSRSGLVSFD